jgi:hypothetical protein
MINTLSAAYFVNEILIPNISGTTATEKANLLDLQITIAKYEPLFLKDLLGETLFAAYAAGIAAGSPETRWVTLNNKINYTNTALSTLGTGLSPAANYCYFHWMRNQQTVTLMNGEGRAGAENFGQASAMEKMVNAWNELVRMSDIIQDWLIDNKTTYPEMTTMFTRFERINQFFI